MHGDTLTARDTPRNLAIAHQRRLDAHREKWLRSAPSLPRGQSRPE
jgi:hypothetical protein